MDLQLAAFVVCIVCKVCTQVLFYIVTSLMVQNHNSLGSFGLGGENVQKALLPKVREFCYHEQSEEGPNGHWQENLLLKFLVGLKGLYISTYLSGHVVCVRYL